MMKMRAFLFRYRLLSSLLALALLLGALAVSPAKADIGQICSTGCINWTQGRRLPRVSTLLQFIKRELELYR